VQEVAPGPDGDGLDSRAGPPSPQKEGPPFGPQPYLPEEKRARLWARIVTPILSDGCSERPGGSARCPRAASLAAAPFQTKSLPPRVTPRSEFRCALLAHSSGGRRSPGCKRRSQTRHLPRHRRSHCSRPRLVAAVVRLAALSSEPRRCNSRSTTPDTGAMLCLVFRLTTHSCSDHSAKYFCAVASCRRSAALSGRRVLLSRSLSGTASAAAMSRRPLSSRSPVDAGRSWCRKSSAGAAPAGPNQWMSSATLHVDSDMDVAVRRRRC
jgi:hypothetical protein